MTYLPDGEESEFEIPDFGVRLGVRDEDDESLNYLADPIPGYDNATTTHAGAPSAPGCSVTNPDQTVTATATIDGRLQRVSLHFGSGSSASISEDELSREILLVGRLAGRKARAQLFDFLLDGSGEDVESTRHFLRDELGLPTPEQAAAEQAEAFGIRLRDNNE